MKKLILILSIGLLPLMGLSQQFVGDLSEQRIDYDLAFGDSTFTTKNLLGFSRLSFQLTTTNLDAPTADVQIQKTNNGKDFLDISGASLMLSSGSQTSFIEIENAKNARYKIIIDVGTVTSGTLRIDIAATR